MMQAGIQKQHTHTKIIDGALKRNHLFYVFFEFFCYQCFYDMWKGFGRELPKTFLHFRIFFRTKIPVLFTKRNIYTCVMHTYTGTTIYTQNIYTHRKTANMWSISSLKSPWKRQKHYPVTGLPPRIV